jgi:Organic radical activating enzymes
MSAELQSPECGTKFNNRELIEIVKKYASVNSIDGVTVSGGDPLEQPDELIDLLAGLKPFINDILVFTGFTLEEAERRLNNDQISAIKNTVSLLVDGRFEEENRDNNPLRGSANQKIHFFDPSVRLLYEEYFSVPHKVETRLIGHELLFIGIPKQVQEE